MRPLSEIIQNPRVTVMQSGVDGGAFSVRRNAGGPLRVVVGVGGGWDHVSVSLPGRTPNYQEMKMVKRIFFRPDEWAVEYHPPDADYISVNDHVLHLWRPHDVEIPVPPMEFV